MASLTDEPKSDIARLDFDRRSQLKEIADDLLFPTTPVIAGTRRSNCTRRFRA